MIRNLLLRALLLAGIGTNIAFLLINIKPERPRLTPPQHYTVLVRMSPQDAAWLQENILSEFGATHDLDLKVETVPSYEALVERLRAEAKHSTGVLLASISDGLAEQARDEGLIIPATAKALPAQRAAIDTDYFSDTLAQGRLGTKDVWLIPSRSEVDVALFSETAVEDAYMHWEADRPAIDAALKEVNGYGLPKGYDLERAPDGWDSYDVFVAGWYWAHHPAPWAGEGHQGIGPRLVLRGGKSEAQLRDLLNTFYRHGATDAEIAAGKLDAPGIIDALQWQALWVRYGLAIVGKAGHGVEPEEMKQVVRESEFAWIPASGEMSFRLHGGSLPGADAGVENPGDLAWSPVPRGESAEIKDERPARVGRSFSLDTTYFWAVPKNSPDPQMALKLARFSTSVGLAQREAEALGTIPVRNDIRKTYPILFRLSWMQDIFDASFKQLERGTGHIPHEVASAHLDTAFQRLQQSVVFTPIPGPLTQDAIRKRIQESSHAQP